MVHSGGIGNDFELHTQFCKQGRLMVHSYGIWYDMELQRTFWKQGRYNGAFRRHSKLFGTAEKKTEIKDNKLCMLAAFERNWNCRDHFDTRTLSRALFWHIMKCHLKLPWEEATHALTSLRGRELDCAPAILDLKKKKDGDWCTRMLF